MRILDFGVILLYLLGITWFGARFRESQKSLRDYFLGGRNAPWWAIGFSIVSAETSTLTVIGTPAIAFGGNMTFLQLVLGYLLARIVISFLFLPYYFRGEMFTAYELMQVRFGPRIRRLSAGTFLVLRAFAEGVRVFAISLVVSILLDTNELLSIGLIVCLTLFYTFEGGMTAVIWTDVVQMFLYMAGAIVSFFVLLQLIPGGWQHVVATASAFGTAAGTVNKFQVLDFSLDPGFLAKPYTFWAGVIGGTMLATASHGTEQLMVQRLLSAKTLNESRAALFASWAVIAFQFTLFLLIGIMLAVYYRENGMTPPADSNRIYPEFIWQKLPPGISGLVIAAILAAAMSNLSAALNSLASTTVMDFYKPIHALAGKERSEAYYLRLSKWATVVWGVVLFFTGHYANQMGGSVLQAGLSIASLLYGALLGVFLLGLLTKRVGEKAAMIGMFSSTVLMLYIWTQTKVPFTWYVLIGTVCTVVVGLSASLVLRERPAGEAVHG